MIAASTYGVGLTRAAQSMSDAGGAGVSASAVVVGTSASPSVPDPTVTPSSRQSVPSSADAQSASSSRPQSVAPTSSRSAASTRPSRPSTAPSSTAATTTAPASPTAPASSPAPPSAPAPEPTSAAPAPAPATQFKDGTYSAAAEYNSPGGVEKVGVTLTLAGDVVTGSSLELFGTGIAKSYQSLFQQNYAPQVNGKKVDSIQLGAVGGSSLTSGGFNAALQAIEDQARA